MCSSDLPGRTIGDDSQWRTAADREEEGELGVDLWHPGMIPSTWRILATWWIFWRAQLGLGATRGDEFGREALADELRVGNEDLEILPAPSFLARTPRRRGIRGVSESLGVLGGASNGLQRRHGVEAVVASVGFQ